MRKTWRAWLVQGSRMHIKRKNAWVVQEARVSSIFKFGPLQSFTLACLHTILRPNLPALSQFAVLLHFLLPFHLCWLFFFIKNLLSSNPPLRNIYADVCSVIPMLHGIRILIMTHQGARGMPFVWLHDECCRPRLVRKARGEENEALLRARLQHKCVCPPAVPTAWVQRRVHV